MPDPRDLLAPLVGGRPSTSSDLLLLVHVPLGPTCVAGRARARC